MLIPGSELINTPVMSLQTGAELAATHTAVINPHKLTVEAYVLSGPTLDSEVSLLRTLDIREIGAIGMIIDSSDEFITPGDVIKLDEIYALHFTLENKLVLNEKRHKVGKVIDYTVDVDSFSIEQLNVRRPLLKSFNDDELIIHRSQIIEITDDAIVIKEMEVTPMPTLSQKSFANPFRGTTPQAEGIDVSQDE